jgi:hypothetical protein
MIMTVIVMFSPGLVTTFLDKGKAPVEQSQELNFQMESNQPAVSSGSGEIQFNLDGQTPVQTPEPAKKDSNELNFQLDK